jgi:hypothetical protein
MSLLANAKKYSFLTDIIDDKWIHFRGKYTTNFDSKKMNEVEKEKELKNIIALSKEIYASIS